jgi:hypothetical protein
MKYQPNFNDPRVIKRVSNAIGFTKAMTSSKRPKPISTRFIDKHFGMQSHKLSKYLRNTLLICVNHKYNKDSGTCKSYVSNTLGMSFLVEAVNQSSRVPVLSSGVINPVNDSFHNNILIKGGVTHKGRISVTQVEEDYANQWASNQYREELETLEFQYEEKSHRQWNTIQSIRNETRVPLLAQYGLKHQYDIKTCAPTLLYQYSFMVPDATGVVLETLEHYLQHSDSVRQDLATRADMTLSEAKETITSLFAGAVLSRYPGSSVMKRLDGDIAKVEFLQQDVYLSNLREDIKEMWEPIKETVPPTYMIDKNGNKRKRPFNARAKWNIYFQLERKVMHCCYAYLESKDNKYFNEHDGFTSQKEVDLKELSQFIQHNTGFNLTFEKKI